MKDQETVNTILKSIFAKTQEEITGLLGQEVVFAPPECSVVSKKNFFSQSTDKQILTLVSVDGDRQGTAFLCLKLKDALLLGGTLLMLPPKELEERINKEAFDEEAADSYGEIANIIGGVINSVFGELYSEKLHFARKEFEVVSSAEVDMDSERPFPPQDYYLAASAMQMGGQNYGALQFLLPLPLLDLEQDVAESAASASSTEKKSVPPPEERAAEPTEKETAVEPASESMPQEEAGHGDWLASLSVLVIAEEQDDSGVVKETLEAYGLNPLLMNYTDDVKGGIPGGGVRGVFLILHAVSEQGLGLLIKMKTICGTSIPIIVAGPDWTRKSVLQAVKYGAKDILVTPAVSTDIKKKIEIHLGKSLTPAD